MRRNCWPYLDRAYAERVGSHNELEARIDSMEVAFRMQTEAPDVFDVSKEPEAIRQRYGSSDFGRSCLMASRMVQRGVRMVEVYFGPGQPWDSHDDILVQGKLARDADPAIAALIQDLKDRRLLDSTIVLIGYESSGQAFAHDPGADYRRK